MFFKEKTLGKSVNNSSHPHFGSVPVDVDGKYLLIWWLDDKWVML